MLVEIDIHGETVVCSVGSSLEEAVYHVRTRESPNHVYGGRMCQEYLMGLLGVTCPEELGKYIRAVPDTRF